MLTHTYPCPTHPAASRKMDDKLRIPSYYLKLRTNEYVEDSALPPALQVAIREEGTASWFELCMQCICGYSFISFFLFFF